MPKPRPGPLIHGVEQQLLAPGQFVELQALGSLLCSDSPPRCRPDRELRGLLVPLEVDDEEGGEELSMSFGISETPLRVLGFQTP